MLCVWLLKTSHEKDDYHIYRKDKSRRTVPFHVDAAGRSKRVEAVEDPVARYLDSTHWRNKEKLETKNKQKQPRI